MRPTFQKIYLKDQSSFSVQRHIHTPKVVGTRGLRVYFLHDWKGDTVQGPATLPAWTLVHAFVRVSISTSAIFRGIREISLGSRSSLATPCYEGHNTCSFART